MNAAKLNILWFEDEPTAGAALRRVDGPSGLDSRMCRAARGRPARCPMCDSIIYSRRHPLCGRCGRPLPADCLFSPPEAAGVEAVLRRERQRHRLWLQRAGQRVPG